MVSLLNTVDTCHEDMIHDAKLDYYGIRMATASSDKSVRLFHVENGRQIPIAKLIGHEAAVWEVSWANPKFGNLLASCSYDRKVIVWQETQPGEWIKHYEYANHSSSVNSVDWGPPECGLVFACGSSDGTISVVSYTEGGGWEARKIHNAHSVGCNSVSWCSEGPEKCLVSGGCDHFVKVWKEADINQGGGWNLVASLEGHADWVQGVAWAPISGDKVHRIASCSQDKQVMVWTSSGLSLSSWTLTVVHEFDEPVWDVSWSQIGLVLAASAGDGKVMIWKRDLEGKWKCLSDITNNNGRLTTMNGSKVTSGEEMVT
ncbi:protein SEC13 homolog [Hetaerina americana]|uniref:protein SEC13 homolog n=1 Tax=Hetaerina americana TaxID=62018 RepID=UPI003A7F5EB0